MKRIIVIMLVIAMLMCSCGTAEEGTSEPTTESTVGTEGTTEATEPSEEVTEPTTEATEPSTEAPTEPDSEPKEGIYADLKKINMMVIGEYATIQEAFAGCSISELKIEDGYTNWNRFWEEYQEAHPIGYKEGFYIDGRTDAGFLVEIVANDSDGTAEAEIQSVYAFNTLYDTTVSSKDWVYKEFGKSGRPLYIADDIAVKINYFNVSFWYKGGAYYLPGSMFDTDGFRYDAYVEDGVMRYMRFRYVTHMQSFYDWALEYWYPGYGDELAAEYGTVTLENGELVFTPDETYTISEWLVKVWKIDEKIDEFGCESIDELFEKYLSGEIDIFKHPSL